MVDIGYYYFLRCNEMVVDELDPLVSQSSQSVRQSVKQQCYLPLASMT